MATKTFQIRTEPHIADLGTAKLNFLPEVAGALFVEAYNGLRAVQTKLNGRKANSTKHAKSDEDISPEVLLELSEAMTSFVRKFLVSDDERAKFDSMEIPDRVLADLLNWLAELYGGGSGNPDAATGTSSA